MTVSQRGSREGTGFETASKIKPKPNQARPGQTQATWSLSKRNSSKIECQAPRYFLMYVWYTYGVCVCVCVIWGGWLMKYFSKYFTPVFVYYVAGHKMSNCSCRRSERAKVKGPTRL